MDGLESNKLQNLCPEPQSTKQTLLASVLVLPHFNDQLNFFKTHWAYSHFFRTIIISSLFRYVKSEGKRRCVAVSSKWNYGKKIKRC